MVAIQMINILKNLHAKGYVHRDMKPENFVIGLNTEIHKIYLIDFGLSKKFVLEDGNHAPLI